MATSAPATPTGVTVASTTATSATITWTAATQGAANTPSNYGMQIQQAVNTGTWTTYDVTVLGTASSYTFYGLDLNTKYYYRLYAINNIGNSGFSSNVNSTTKTGSSTITPVVVQSNTYIATTATASFGFSAQTPNSANNFYVFFNGYAGQTQANSNAITPPTGSTVIVPATYTTSEVMWCWKVPYSSTNSWSFTNFDFTDQAAAFKIVEVSNVNTIDSGVGPVTSATATSIAWPLAAPTSTNCARLTNLSIQFKVTAGTPSAGVQILQNDSASTYHQAILLSELNTVTTPTLAITGGTPADTDGYVNLQFYGIIAPPAVASLSYSGLTWNSIKLSWPSLGSAVTAYSVEVSTDNGTTWTSGLTASTVSSATSSLTLTSLSAGTPYQFRVVGDNDYGVGPASPIVKVTTPAVPSLQIIQHALGFDQTLAGTMSLTLPNPTSVGNTLQYFVTLQNTAQNLALTAPFGASNVVLPTPDTNTTNAMMSWTQVVNTPATTYTLPLVYSGLGCFEIVEVQGVTSVQTPVVNQSLTYTDNVSVILPVTAPSSTPALGLYCVNMSFNPDSWGTMPSNIVKLDALTGNSATPVYQYHTALVVNVPSSVAAGNYTLPFTLGGTFTQQNQNVGTTPNPVMIGTNLIGAVVYTQPGGTILQFSSITQTSMVLTWVAATGTVTNYQINYSVNSNMSASTAINVPSGLTTTLTGLTSGTLYYFTITAFNNSASGPVSAIQSQSTGSSTNHSFVLIGGQLFSVNGQIAEL